MVHIFFLSVWYQLKIAFRVKESVIFSSVFPLFIFVLFSSVWGSYDDSYIPFILTGMLGVTCVSEGMFSIGGVVKQYHASRLIKFFRNLPTNISILFSGIAVSRGLIMMLLALVLVAIANIVFGYKTPFFTILTYLVGALLGVAIFSFIGLIVSFLAKKEDPGMGLLAVFFYPFIFLSDAFYPLSSVNKPLGAFIEFFPLTHMLKFLRGEVIYGLFLIMWIVILASIFSWIFSKKQILR